MRAKGAGGGGWCRSSAADIQVAAGGEIARSTGSDVDSLGRGCASWSAARTTSRSEVRCLQQVELSGMEPGVVCAFAATP